MPAPLAVSPQYADGTLKDNAANPLDAQEYKGKPEAETDAMLVKTVEQVQYQSFLETRLTTAQAMRDRNWPEFSNKTYLQQYEANEKISNTYLEPKKNEDDVIIASGTIESKLNTLLSNIEALNLMVEYRAFDQSNMPLHDLGRAITDVSDRCAETDGGIDGGDTEKRMLRQKDLLKQGTVFIQDRWACKYKQGKKVTGKYKGEFNWDGWTSALVKSFEGPERVLLYGPNVYLGDITQFAIDDQPYLFTVEQMHIDMAKGLFGQFENWKYVRAGAAPSTAVLAQNAVGGRTIYDGKFRLTTLKNDQVEVIKYQDQTRDEFQIIINGIMMLPIGFPLSAITPGGKYNIAKQILYPINPQFAYGKSFVASGDVYELSKIIDELLRLFVLKTRKSVTPAYINTSGRIISRRVLSPGNITQGVPAGALQAIGTESQGVTTGEYQIYKELLTRVEESTVSPIFQGQFGKANTTATEVLQVQEQAKKSLGLILAACTMMEVKLGYLRLPIILNHWFKPTGGTMENGTFQNTYRSTSVPSPIADDGAGIRRVIPVDGALPNEEMTRWVEIAYEKQYGQPFEVIFVSPQELAKQRITWMCVAVPRQKESSAYDKIIFGEMVAGITQLVNMGSQPNTVGIETEFAKTFGVDRNKIFANKAEVATQAPDLRALAARNGGDISSGEANAPGAPSVSPGMKKQVVPGS